MSAVTPAGLEAMKRVANASHTYVALADCGCVRGCIVDSEVVPRGDRAAAVASWIRRGLTIERWPTEKVREVDWRCGKDTCPFHAHKTQIEMEEPRA